MFHISVGQVSWQFIAQKVCDISNEPDDTLPQGDNADVVSHDAHIGGRSSWNNGGWEKLQDVPDAESFGHTRNTKPKIALVARQLNLDIGFAEKG